MAKRFIDTNLLKKKFIRDCEAPDKLLFIFLFLHCNHAGIWDYDLGEISLYCGQNIDNDKFNKIVGSKVIFFDNNEKVFIPSFIPFQYNELKNNNPAHKNVIIELQKFNLINENLQVINNQLNTEDKKVLQSSFQGAMDMEKEKEMDKVKEENEKLKLKITELEKKLKSKSEKKEEAKLNFSKILESTWGRWTNYKKSQFKFEYKSKDSEQIAINELIKLSNDNDQKANELINLAIAKCWKGIYLPKDENIKHKNDNSGYFF